MVSLWFSYGFPMVLGGPPPRYVPELFIDIAAALGFQCGEDKDLAVTKVG